MDNVNFMYPAVQSGQEVVGEDGNKYVVVNGEVMNLVDMVFHCKLVQPGSLDSNPELAPHSGKFYIEELKESMDSMEVVPIKLLNDKYTLFAKYDKKKKSQEALCYSMNGETPSPKSKEIQSTRCGVGYCERASFLDSKPPECQRTVRVIFYYPKMNIIMQMDIYRTGLSAWNKLLREYKTKIAVSKIKKVDFSTLIVTATVENKGTFAKLELSLDNSDTVSQYAAAIEYYSKWYAKECSYPTTSGVPEAETEAEVEVESGVHDRGISDIPF